MLEGTLEVKFHGTRPRLLSEGYGARKKGEWSELNKDRDGDNGGDPQRLPQLDQLLCTLLPSKGLFTSCEDSAEKCNAHVICHFNNSLLGTWHLSSKTLFPVPSQKKIFPNYTVKKVNAQLPENTKNVSTIQCQA